TRKTDLTPDDVSQRRQTFGAAHVLELDYPMADQAEGVHIQGFWSGPPLTYLLQACLRSFLRCGHQFTVYSYGPVAVPHGALVPDANQIVPERDVFYFQNPETHQPDIAPFADYFRMKLLADLGGWYCDIDTVCLSKTLPVGPRIWARQCPEFGLDSVNN